METENGFLYRQECDIVVVGEKEIPDAKWLNIHLDEDDDSSNDETCTSHADLALAASDNESVVLCGPRPRFDGTFKDTKTGTKTSGVRKQRSDAALLLGLALTCQDLGHIVIRTVKCRFRKNPKTSEEHSTETRRMVACMYITFYVPEVYSKRGRHNDRQFITLSSKVLPSSTQLLLMLMRSDWDFLDSVISETSDNLSNLTKTIRGRNASLFPSKLHLNEVYPRIGSAASLDQEIAQELKSRTDPERLALDSLPRDILQHRIAVFLKARSLDSLRSTCKSFHRDLRSVVPGLKLKLYSHQIKSLGWMRSRETKTISEDDLVYATSRRVLSIDGDPHRAASGGASTRLTDRTEGTGVHISQSDGTEVIVQRDSPLSRMVARGGMLCDDPGLGKTITVLSLLLQTFGLSTTSSADEKEENREDEEETEKARDQRIFEEYWSENLVPRDRTTLMLSFLMDLRRNNRYTFGYFEKAVDPIKDGCPDYYEVIKEPLYFKKIRDKANKCEYESFESFERDIEKLFENNLEYFAAKDEIVHKAAVEMRESFRDLSKQLKAKTLKTAKKSFARAGAKPNSTVAALVEKSRLKKLKNSLIPSSATLLVVPGVLLEHWEEQLKLHVDTEYCTDKTPIVFTYNGESNNCKRRMKRILRQCDVDRTHHPLLFIDKTGTKKLPSPSFLSKFSVVLTTNQRFTNEWKNGSFEDELNRKQGNGSQFREDDEKACALLKVHWLRMIVDEGHSMGKGKVNSAILFASWINAERRWVMTGTPTRQTLSQTGLTSIQHLLHYLGHTFFSRRQNGDYVWKRLISQGWNRGDLASFYRIQALLSLLMVRHTKLDIEELPSPQYQTTVLPMSAEEVTTYNTLVCAVQSNLLITSMEGKTSGRQDSLLDKSQSRHAKRALENVRLVCAGGTQVLPTLDEKNWTEFIRDFGLCNPHPEKREHVQKYLSRAVMGDLSPCASCGMMLSTLLVFPCGDLVCTECADRDSHECVVCSEPFDVDLFQRLQPGMVYEWLHNVEEDLKKKKRREETSSPPTVDVEDPIIALDGGAGVLALLDPTQQRRRTRKPGDGHTCEYSPKRADGQCILCWKPHDSCNFMAPSRQCRCCFQRAEDCPESETKSFNVVSRLLQLYNNEQQDHLQRNVFPQSKDLQPGLVVKRPLKAIVFSQFRKVLNMAGDRLLRRFGSGCVAEYWGSYRRQELSRFVHDDACFCMLLGKDGSEGLDLSFVTHIFFMEEVWDKSLQEQAVARAWRMGAKGSVVVETLVAQSSVEETMAEMEKKSGDSGLTIESGSDAAHGETKTSKLKSSEYQRAKLQYLLRGLSLVANQYTSSFGVNKRSAEVHSLMAEPASKKQRKTNRRVRFQL